VPARSRPVVRTPAGRQSPEPVPSDRVDHQTSFETNRILKILAVITSISVIPAAVSGILGTNLLDTPYDATLWQLTFIITTSMSFATYTFVKLGWLKS
jgi:Mg2+ and Co2+ transporter CorA